MKHYKIIQVKDKYLNKQNQLITDIREARHFHKMKVINSVIDKYLVGQSKYVVIHDIEEEIIK